MIWLRYGHLSGSCDFGNEISGFKNCEKFPYYLRNYWLLNKSCAPWSYLQLHTWVHFLNRLQLFLEWKYVLCDRLCTSGVVYGDAIYFWPGKQFLEK